MYYGGFLYREAYNLPLEYKRWFVERIVKEINKGGEESNNSRAMHHNSPEVREMQGMARSQSPSRLRRFT
jgi:hypothetical protein